MNESNGNFVEEGLTAHLHNDEDLVNIQQDFNKMPVCAEQIILKLIYYSNKTLRVKIEPFSLNIDTELGLLFEKLSVEGLLTNKVDELYKEIKSYLTYKDYSNASRKLKSILCELRDLNIQELLRLTRANNQALDLITDKNIYLLIGLTGSGKSTTLHFLGGSKMEKVSINGQHHIEATEVTNEYLKKVKLSASINSETRHIIPVLIKLGNSPSLVEDTAIFCDSPGFEDTNGPEIDISNSIGMQKCVQVCKGVKPIVVTSKLAGDRFQGLARLAQLLNCMFTNLKENLKHFSFIYTKYSIEEKSSLEYKLQNIKNDLIKKIYDDTDEIFQTLIVHMLENFTKNSIILNPLNDNITQVVDFLIGDQMYILQPARHFNVTISFKSLSKILAQIERHFRQIKRCVDKCEFELAAYKLDELKQLNEILHTNTEFVQKYTNYLNDFLSQISREKETFLVRFNEKISKSCPIDMDDDKDEYLKHLKIQTFLNKFYSTHKLDLDDNFIDLSNLILDKFKEKSIDKDLNLIKIDLDNLKVLMSLSNENDSDSTYKKYINQLEASSNKFTNDVIKSIDSIDLTLLVDHLTILNVLGEQFKQHLINSTQYYRFLKLGIVEYLKTKASIFDKILNTDSLTQMELLKLNEIDDYFNQYLTNIEFKKHIPLNEINIHYEGIKNSLLTRFNKYSHNIDDECSSVKSQLDKSMKSSFEIIHDIFDQMELFRLNLSRLKYLTESAHTAIVDNIIGLFGCFNCQIHESIQKADYSKLISLTKWLMNLKWFEAHKKKAAFCINDINEAILNHVKDLEKLFIEVDTEQLAKAYEYVEATIKIKKLIEIYPELEKPITNVNTKFCDEINQRFNSYSQIFKQDDIEDDVFEASLAYLQTFKSLKTSLSNLNSTCALCLSEAKVFIEKSSQLIDKELTEFIELLDGELIPDEMFVEKVKMVDVIMRKIQAKSTHKHIWQLAGHQLDSIKDNLKKSLVNISKSIEICFDAWICGEFLEKASKKLANIRTLTSLDSHLKEENVPPLFNSLYLKYNQKLSQCIQTIYKRTLALINNAEFEQAKYEIAKLTASRKQSDYLKSIRNLLNKKLYRMFQLEKIQCELPDLEHENLEFFKTVNVHIEKCIELAFNLKDFLNDADLKYLAEYEKKVKEILNEFLVEYLNSINKLIDQMSLANALDRMKRIMRQQFILLKFAHAPICERINGLKDEFRQCLFKFCQEFDRYVLEDYPVHPPLSFYNQLNSLTNAHDLTYEAKRKLKDIVLKKYQCELEKAKIIHSQNVSNNQHLIKCLRYCSEFYLPNEYKVTVDDMIKECQKEIGFKIVRIKISNHSKTFLNRNLIKIFNLENLLLIVVFGYCFYFFVYSSSLISFSHLFFFFLAIKVFFVIRRSTSNFN